MVGRLLPLALFAPVVLTLVFLFGPGVDHALCRAEVRITGLPRVVDGDTLDFDADVVRLWGINAAEAGTVAGRAASAYLEAIIASGDLSCVWAPDGQDRDPYGRMVAVCCIDGRDVAAELVAAEHAQDWPEYSGGWYAR